ncbi:MAG: hypothetical protein ABH871_06180 [Pseudomonadota bacterium]
MKTKIIHIITSFVFFMLMLLCISCSRGDIDKASMQASELSYSSEQTVNQRLAEELVRHGRMLLRSGRYGAAMDSAMLAAFLSDKAEHTAFESECRSALLHAVKNAKRQALDARDAGDLRQFTRIENTADAMEQSLEAR